MKTLRSWWSAFVVVTLAACSSSDTEVAPGARLGGACTDSASMTRAEIEAGGVLCEHQTLVASIRPGDDLKLSFRTLTPGDVDLCFDDDDAEPHEATLHGTSVVAQAPCQTVSLPAGDHTLGLRHALREAGGRDERPDVLHTKWTPPTSTSRGRLQLMANGCPGCRLDKPWPPLSSDKLFGYVGDYTGATILGFCAQGDLTATCQLGGIGTTSSFERAVILLRPGNQLYSLGGDATKMDDPTNGESNFRGATLMLDFNPNVHLVRADATAMKIESNFPLAYVARSNLTGLDLGSYNLSRPSTTAGVEDSRIDVVTFVKMFGYSPSTAFRRLTVTVPEGQSFAGLSIDGRPKASDQIFFDWPLDKNGLLSMAKASFENATLRNLTLPCPTGGDLRGARFAGATLDAVSLSGCNLTEARFAGATLTNVIATKSIFVRADLTDVKVNVLNVTEASLSEATLTNAPNSPWIGLVAHAVTAGSLDAKGLVTGLDASGRGSDFSNANLRTANFSNAQLPRADFRRAALVSTNFSSAILAGANFDDAVGDGPSFESAYLEGSNASPTSMHGATFVAPNFQNALLQGTKLTSASVCGGDFLGAHLEGTDLTGTVMPVESNIFTFGGKSFDCQKINGLTPNATNEATKCPNETMGPCSDAQWIPLNMTPQCPPDVPRKKSGAACTTACECTLVKCIGGTCG